MATTTSSRNRNKRKAKQPVTNSSSRTTNSGARVTNSSQRTNTGSARVTGTPQRALPPGRQGGAIATSGQRGGALVTRADADRLRGSSDSVRGTGTRTGQPGANRPALPPAKPPAPKPSGTYRAPSIPKPPKAAASKPSMPAAATTAKAPRGGNAAAIAGQLIGSALSPLAFKAGVALGNNVLRPIGEAIDRATGQGKPTAKPSSAPTTSRFAGARDREFERASKIEPTGSTPRRASTSGSGSGGGGRSSGGGSSAPSRPASRPSAPAMPSAVTKATPTAAAPKPASKGPNIGPMADGDKYGKAKKLESKIAGTSDTDMKRRRAFLDSKDSMSGAKAVRELQEKRKKKLAGLTQ